MTVDLSFATKGDWEEVYEPSEDTFLMEDVLESDRKCITEMKPCFICEVGCGSGYLTSCLLSILKGGNDETSRKMPLPLSFMTDVNIKALRLSRKLLKHNHPEVAVELVQMNLFSSLRANNPGRYYFDIVIFNPPYVPSSNRELINASLDAGIDSSWSGGTDGLFHISYFVFGDARLISGIDQIALNDLIGNYSVPIPCLLDILVPNGICYVLLEKRNRPKYVIGSILADERYLNWSVEIISEKKVSLEHLYVLKFLRKS